MTDEKKYTYKEYHETFYPTSTRRQTETHTGLTPEELGDKLAQETLQKMKEKFQEVISHQNSPAEV